MRYSRKTPSGGVEKVFDTALCFLMINVAMIAYLKIHVA